MDLRDLFDWIKLIGADVARMPGEFINKKFFNKSLSDNTIAVISFSFWFLIMVLLNGVFAYYGLREVIDRPVELK